jgi:hypothetical protein
MEDTLQSTIELALILLLVIFVVGGRTDQTAYTIALLLAGLSESARFHDIHLTPDLIRWFFCSVLLFEGATMCARAVFWRTLPIGCSLFGCLDHRCGDRAMVHFWLGFAWGIALLLAR